MNAAVYKDYYNYLLERAGLTESEMRAYSNLFGRLFSKEFRWLDDSKDINRAADGEKLRNDFKEDVGGLTPSAFTPCSVLEMLVALSSRCENEIMGVPDIDNTRQWFWDMLNNLGLENYSNNRWNPTAVERILDRMIFRRYDYSGNGGLFPLRSPASDQRDVEIWYQLASWLNENYDLTG